MSDYGLLGHPLGHSISPEIHNIFGYDYELYDTEPTKIEEFLAKNLLGFNVTIPYKRVIMDYLDEVDATAYEIGAVNTVVRRDNKLYGYNTDVLGMEYALKKAGIEIACRSVVILGSGGTSRTAQVMCKRLGAKKVTVVSRSGEINYTNYKSLTDTEIIINTTPVGMYPNIDDKLIDIDSFPSLKGGFDVVYNPLETEFVRAFRERNIPCINGLLMLVAQAKFARDIFLGNRAEDSLIDEVYDSLLKRFRNVVLIGMPGCGKSSVAHRLATKYKRVLIDTDKLIEDGEDKTIPEIFDEVGEKGFRDIEERAIKGIAGYRGSIVSCGGGVVVREENIKNLKRNGIVVYIKRDIDKLSREGRPLSNTVGVEKLYNDRRSLYEGYADYVVDNDTTLDECVRKVEEMVL